MNKIWNELLGGSATEKREPNNIHVKTSGKLFDWCSERLEPMNLHINTPTPYRLSVCDNNGNVIGYYNTLTEIKEAIKGNYVHESYNL